MNKKVLFLAIASMLLTGCKNPEDMKYTVTWKNYDGTVLEVDRDLKYGDVPTYDGATPAKPNSGLTAYNFAGWDPQVIAVRSDATYTAKFTEDSGLYTITWLDYDGTVLEKDENVERGTIPTCDVVPSRDEDDTYVYTFFGWTPTVVGATKDATYTAVYSSKEKSTIYDLGKLQIWEAREKCNLISSDKLNKAGIYVDLTRKMTIEGFLYGKADLVKTKSAFGYDLSTPYKLFLADATGYIGVSVSKQLFDKYGSYVLNSTSKYKITAYPSIYMGSPELYVVDSDDFEWDQNLEISFDATKLAKETIALSDFANKAVATPYNCSGHGYGDMYTINGVTCYGQDDANYMFTDGSKVIKTIKTKNASFSVGLTYNITGYISLKNWMPAMYVLNAKIASTPKCEFNVEDTILTTVDNFRKLQRPEDDTDKKQDAVIRMCGNIYRSECHVGAYNEGDRFYPTMMDTVHEGIITGHVTAYTQYNMITFSNPSCWAMKTDYDLDHCPIGDWIDQSDTVTLYYSAYLCDAWINNNSVHRPYIRAFLVEELVNVPANVID